MAESRVNYLFKNTAIFTIGNLATKVISFFFIPLYTNVLSTAEYGTVDLVVTISTIAVSILTFNIMESVMRFNLDKDVNRNKITRIGITVLAFTFLLGLILIPICSLYDKVRELGIIVYFYVMCLAASQMF